MENVNILLSVLIGVLLLSVGLLTGLYIGSNKPVEVVEKDIPVITTEFVGLENTTIAEMADKYLKSDKEKDLKNDTAKDAVLDEKDKKAFKLVVLDVLNDNEIEELNVESYKDLDIYSFVFDSVKIKKDVATVIVTLKVSGFEDGDDELDFKTRLKAEFEVSGLDIDDDFEDLEVELIDLELERVY